MIITHMQNRLDAMGYFDMEMNYDLGYCQGSGVAWYGELTRECLEVLLPRLTDLGQSEVAKMLNVLRDYRRYETIRIYRNNHRYCHEGTMTIESTVCFTDMFSDEGCRDGAEVTLEQLERWDTNWRRFVCQLGRDVHQLSKELCRECYTLIEARTTDKEVIWERSTDHFKVQLCAMPVDSEEQSIDWVDEDVKLALIQDLLAGKQRFVNLTLTIKERAHGTEVGSATFSDVMAVTENPMDYGVARKLLRKAVNESREFIQESRSAYMAIKAAA